MSRNVSHNTSSLVISSILICTSLAGCGGGGAGTSDQQSLESAVPAAQAASAATTDSSTPTPTASSATAEDAASTLTAIEGIAAGTGAYQATPQQDAATGAADGSVAIAPADSLPTSATEADTASAPIAVTAATGTQSLPVESAGLQMAAAAAVASTCAPTLASDFIDNAMWAYRRLLPRDCAIAPANPVTFSWLQPKDRDTSKPWTLTITTSAGGAVSAPTTSVPRLTLASPLAQGSYRWKVSYVTTTGKTVTSSERRFSVDATTRAVSLPTAASLLATLKARAAPRLLPAGKTWAGLASTASAGEYKNAFSMLARTADGMLTQDLPVSPESRARTSFTTDTAYASWMLGLMQLTGEELRRIEALAYAARLTDSKTYLAAAKTRMLALATWSPTGASSETSQPQANRNIYLALAIAYDLLESDLTAAERLQVATAINTRLAAAVAATDRLDREPYASFENSTIHFATQALMLVAGRTGFDTATALLPKTWALCIAQFQAQGDADGSNGAGTAYGWFDFHHQTRLLATTLVASGVDLTQLPYARQMGDFLIASTVPNASQASSFGDGSELTNLYKSYSGDAYRLYAAVTALPQHEWYWRQDAQNAGLLGYITPLHYAVQAMRPTRATPAAPTATDWVFKDTGVTSFNDGMGATRTSVQFRSSLLGSYNHAHADQNSYTLTSKGVDLLISSGYYPYYLSPHHANVTRATRFKNAVTFDGGIGQAEALPSPGAPTAPVSSMEPRGDLVQYFTQGQVSVVTGDATSAYRGWNATTATWNPLLTAAHRSVAYLKSQGIVLVYDWLASGTARRWELNYHSPQAFTTSGAQLVAARSGTKACIEHQGPAGALTLSSGFPIAPEQSGAATQYHAQWAVNAATPSAGVLTVIRLECNTTPVSVAWAGSKASVSISGGTLKLEFDRKTASVTSATN